MLLCTLGVVTSMCRYSVNLIHGLQLDVIPIWQCLRLESLQQGKRESSSYMCLARATTALT